MMMLTMMTMMAMMMVMMMIRPDIRSTCPTTSQLLHGDHDDDGSGGRVVVSGGRSSKINMFHSWYDWQPYTLKV